MKTAAVVAVKPRVHVAKRPATQRPQVRRSSLTTIRNILSTEFQRIHTEEELQLPRHFIGYLRNHPEEFSRFA